MNSNSSLIQHQGNINEITTCEECAALFSQKLAVIFKHSESCSLSSKAYQTVAAFATKRRNFEVSLISVLDSPSASQFVEERTNVRHQSPQILAMQYGHVFAFASHWNITPNFLADIYARLDALGSTASLDGRSL